MTALGLGIVGAGILFVVSGIKDYDPRAVTLALFTGDPIPAKGSTYTSPGTAAPRTGPGPEHLATGRRRAGSALGGAVGGGN